MYYRVLEIGASILSLRGLVNFNIPGFSNEVALHRQRRNAMAKFSDFHLNLGFEMSFIILNELQEINNNNIHDDGLI